MFFFGINIDIDNKLADFVILKKSQKNLKKYYTLTSIISLQNPFDNKKITEQIVSHYNNNSYSIRKRIYNQNNRPSKSILAPPKIVIGFLSKKNHVEKSTLPDELRSKKVSVEALFTGDFKEVIKKEHGRALGDNYFVPKKNIFENLLNIYSQKRFVIDEKISFKNDLEKKLNSKTIFFTHTDHGKNHTVNVLLQTVSYPLWFRENIKYKRSYSV